MDTTDHVLLIILTTLMSLFFLLLTAMVIMGIQVMKSVKRVVGKAEDVVDSVEEATEVLRDTTGPMAMFKLLRNIIKMTNKKGRK